MPLTKSEPSVVMRKQRWRMVEQSIFQSVTPTDLPDGLIFRIRVKPCHEKYFAFTEMQITCMTLPIPHPQGALRDRHGRWARDAVDAIMLQDVQCVADGQVVWS